MAESRNRRGWVKKKEWDCLESHVDKSWACTIDKPFNHRVHSSFAFPSGHLLTTLIVQRKGKTEYASGSAIYQSCPQINTSSAILPKEDLIDI